MSDKPVNPDDAELDNELDETFPASDPPSITRPHGGGKPPGKPEET